MMITLDELLELKPGTTIYVTAPGRGPRKAWSNVLLQESFQGVIKTQSGHSIGLGSGSYSSPYTRHGEALFLNQAEALKYMEELHKLRFTGKLAELDQMIEQLKLEADEMRDNGPGEPDYKYYKRDGDNR